MELTAQNTALVLDSTADFPEGPERFANWHVVPLYVRFGEDSYRDYVDLGPERFYALLREAPVPPSTSQPTPGDFLARYEQLEGFERVFSLHISAKMSGTVESARAAAAKVGGGRVHVVDTQSASAGIAMLALAIQRRLDRGSSDEEIRRVIERYRRQSRVVFTVDTLEFLARGGRIGRARAWAGELLNVKPILTFEAGEIVPVRRVRGAHKAFLEFARAFEEGSEDGPTLRVGIAHADAPERERALRDLVLRTRPRAEVEVATTLGAVVGAHAGPGTVGFFWFDDRE